MKLQYQRAPSTLFFVNDKHKNLTEFSTSNRSVVCIESSNDFYQLKDDWNRLVDESINPHPFILWEWMYTWWETYNDKNSKLYLLALYEVNELVAIAPFYIKYKTPYIARLSMLGEGENKTDAVVSHYPDVIVKEQHREYAISVLSNFLKENTFSSKVFFYASFNLVSEKSIIQEIGLKLSDCIINRERHLENQFVIDLPDDGDKYVAGLSKSTRKQFRLKLSRMKKAGEIEIKTEKNLEEGLNLIEKLHRERWESRTNKCIFDSKQFHAFHKNLCKRFQQQDVMNFRVLHHNNEPIAATYNLNYGSTCYSYLSGFKSGDDKRLSPMFIFDILEIKNLIAKKYDRFDLLASEAENNYKMKYGSEKYPVYQMLWLDKGIIATGILAYLKIRPFLARAYRLVKKT